MAEIDVSEALAQLAQDDQRRMQRAWESQQVLRSWYLVQTGPRFAKRVCQRLVEKQFEIYRPITLRMRPVPREKLSKAQRMHAEKIMRPVPAPLFMNYVFVRFSMSGDAWQKLFQFAGVYGIACEGGLPMPVADSEIAKWQRKAVNGIIPPETKALALFLKTGDEAVVTEGAFSGYKARLQQDVTVAEADESVMVECLLEFLGRKVRVNLKPAQLAKP